MSWTRIAFFFVTSIKIFHNWFRSNATSTWFNTFYLWMTKISTIVSSFFLTCIIICRSDEREWLNRDLTSNNYIHQIIDQMYIKNDVKNFNLSWTNIICRRENVRITLLSLFHESVELTQFIWRMLLSWFVNVKKNDETLKIIEIDIWFELTIAHRDLITIKRASSEFFNHHETISYRFSSTVEIIDCDALSNAIFCRLRWFSLLMHANRDIFLNLETKAMNIVRKWKRKIIRIVIHVYQTIKNAKMRTFEKKSFYHFKAMIQESLMFFIFDDVDSKLEIAKKWFDKLH
jgi:hypothetical protein